MAKHTYQQSGSSPYGPVGWKLRRTQRVKQPLVHLIIACLGCSSGLMLGLALAKLMPETGPAANLKVVLLTFSATLVAYGVNRFSIERGAPLAAVGFRSAGVACVLAISIAGSGMGIGAFSGMTHSAINHRVLNETGNDVGSFITAVNETSLEAGRAGPELRFVADDLARYAACEKSRSCLSHVGYGGYGPVADALHKQSTRSDAMAASFDEGEVARAGFLEELNALYSDYQQVLGDAELTLSERRTALQPIHTEIEQVAAALSDALPVHLLDSYAEELQAGVVIAGQRQASRSVNVILKNHGKALSDTLNSVSRDEATPPAFPMRPGMMASLSYMDDYAAIAAVIIVAELVLPLMLWVLTFQKIAWEIERQSPEEKPSTASVDTYDGIVVLPAPDLSPRPVNPSPPAPTTPTLVPPTTKTITVADAANKNHKSAATKANKKNKSGFKTSRRALQFGGSRRAGGRRFK